MAIFFVEHISVFFIYGSLAKHHFAFKIQKTTPPNKIMNKKTHLCRVQLEEKIWRFNPVLSSVGVC